MGPRLGPNQKGAGRRMDVSRRFPSRRPVRHVRRKEQPSGHRYARPVVRGLRPEMKSLGLIAVLFLAGCGAEKPVAPVAQKSEPAPVNYFHVDTATAGSVHG